MSATAPIPPQSPAPLPWFAPTPDDDKLVCEPGALICQIPTDSFVAPKPSPIAAKPAGEPAPNPGASPGKPKPAGVKPSKPSHSGGGSMTALKQVEKMGYAVKTDGIEKVQQDLQVKSKDKTGKVINGEFDAAGKRTVGPETTRLMKERVTELQNKLVKLGYGKMLGNYGSGKNGVDGVFGDKTRAAYLKAKSDGKLHSDRPLTKIP